MRPRVLFLSAFLLLAFLAFAARPHVAAAASWQTSAPRDAVARYDVAELGLRNKDGAYGECYYVLAEVYDPYGDEAAWQYKWLCADEWTYWHFQYTDYHGWYAVYFSIDGETVAGDDFYVS